MVISPEEINEGEEAHQTKAVSLRLSTEEFLERSDEDIHAGWVDRERGQVNGPDRLADALRPYHPES